MKWVILVLIVLLVVALCWRSPSSPSTSSSFSHPPASAALTSSSAAGYDDIFFVREPLDVSSTPWNGIIGAGTPVRKVGQEGNKVIIETGNGRVTVEASKLTHDPQSGRQIADVLSHPTTGGGAIPSAASSSPAPSANGLGTTVIGPPSNSGSYVNPLVPPPSTGR